MEQHEEPKGSAYPRGRGYGQDYMRGGEVFGGYGYSHRAEYERPRGEERRVSGSADAAAPAGEEVPADDSEDASAGPARFPQDERAGGWEIPHDLEAIRGAERERAEAESGPGSRRRSAPACGVGRARRSGNGRNARRRLVAPG